MGRIVVFGPRDTGKTTYLAALAYWSQLRMNENLFEVNCIGDDARRLYEDAANIIAGAESLEPTRLKESDTIDDIPVYQFQIDVKQQFRKSESISLVVQDYAGEVFDDLQRHNIKPQHQEFLEGCLQKDVSGCLIFLADWSWTDDRHYSKVLETFLHLIDINGRLQDYRIAVALSKCERGELWPGRLEPDIDLFGVHLRQTKRILEKMPRENVKFAALSTFGVLGRNDLRPNRVDEKIFKDGKIVTKSVLRKPRAWKPYGMIAPLYWLSTGRRLRSNV